MKMRRFAKNLGFALLACLPMLAQDAPTTTYTFQTVKYPGDPNFTHLLGINNNDVIAGYYGASLNSMDPKNGFTLVLPSHFTSEDYPKSIQTQVTAINDQTPTKTVGFYIAECGDSTCNHGFEYAGGVYTTVDFPGQPFNQLLGQNDKGQAVGYYSTNHLGTAPDHAYIYDECGNVACTAPGVFELLVIPDSPGGAQATGINDAGNVCGFYIDNHQIMHGFLLVGGTFTTLDFPSPPEDQVPYTAALGLNNKGKVVGSYTNGTGTHGFVYTISDHSWEQIDDPDGIGTTVVNGINDKGTLVGFFGTSPITSGFVATPEK
jgi:hypothetical protein